MTTATTTIEKTKEINSTQDQCILDFIDRPIRGLVIDINRIGLETVFSCCGFPYEDEEEPKSHSYKEAFVIFKEPTLADRESVGKFFYFTSVARHCGWEVQKYSGFPAQWKVFYKVSREGQQFWNQNEDSYSIHDYELLSIAIYRLKSALKDISTYKEKFTITDGNESYQQLDITWHIKPKRPAVIHFKEEQKNEATPRQD